MSMARLGELGALGLAHPVQLGQQLDVLLDRAPGQQRRVLEHVAEPLAVDEHGAATRIEQAGGDLQQRRLAAAGGPDDRDELALVDVERDVVDRLGAVGEDHPDVVERQVARRRASRHSSSRSRGFDQLNPRHTLRARAKRSPCAASPEMPKPSVHNEHLVSDTECSVSRV